MLLLGPQALLSKIQSVVGTTTSTTPASTTSVEDVDGFLEWMCLPNWVGLVARDALKAIAEGGLEISWLEKVKGMLLSRGVGLQDILGGEPMIRHISTAQGP